MSSSADVIVVGGGPCGSFTALNLAKYGVHVKVFEEHSEIGFPAHCSGHISLKGLMDLGLLPLPANVVENTFCGAKFYSPKGTEFAVRFQKPLTCVVNRALFDRHIAELAKSHGVEYYLSTRVESLVFEDGFVKGVKSNMDGNGKSEHAKIVVDVEGVSSRILRQAGLRCADASMMVNGVNAEVEGILDVETDCVQVFLGSAYAYGFYAWIIPRKDGTAKVGLAAKGGNPKELFHRFISKHPVASKTLKTAKISHVAFHPIPLGGFIPKAFSNGFLAVGDAASQVKPTTGGGIILGMNCAKIVAETALEALLADDLSANFLGAYQRRFKRNFGFDVSFMLRVRRMLDAISDEKLDSLIKTCVKLGLNKDLRDFGDLDFQGKALMRLMPKPKILQALLAFFALYLSAKL
ncbi:MAG: NAD(P)/FAD-dependent oxidoreductase [Candidatus Bathyarchaeales archaeon]